MAQYWSCCTLAAFNLVDAGDCAQAMPLKKATMNHPFKPAPSTADLTITDKVVLASDTRAKERMEFDSAVALKQQLEEVCAWHVHPVGAAGGGSIGARRMLC